MNRKDRRKQKKSVPQAALDFQTAQALNTAKQHHQSGQLQQADALYAHALKQSPKHVETLYFFARLKMEIGRLEDAEALLHKAVKLAPKNPNCHKLYGSALRQINRFQDAKRAFEKAHRIAPGDHACQIEIADVLHQLGKYQDALDIYQSVSTQISDVAPIFTSMGLLNTDLGQLEQAEHDYLKAIELDETFGEAFRNLSLIHKFTADDPLVGKMASRVEDPSLAAPRKASILFALAKAYEDLGDLRKSYSYLSEANAMRKAEGGFDPGRYPQIFEKIQQRFENITFPEPTAANPKRQRPIFILGMPRSGTSLVEQILASHSQVYGAGELEAMRRASLPYLSDNSLDNAAAAIRRTYFSFLKDFDVQEPVIVDKMPSNFLWIGFIALAFPDAKIVHMKRDPRAVCWSVFKSYFEESGPALAYALDLDDTVHYYKLYEQLMDFWRRVLPGRIYEQSYEALTERQEDETRQLLAHCELDWENQCLSFHENKRVVNTVSALQVRKKMYQGSSEAWRKFEPFIGDKFKTLSP
ncbi:sulfotransferase [Magnetovibrio sp. PR-2]|uniref:tetratricopeptide repeat-containing sulfotransferase family protein n=1 Tax=Magnetovibrio sp. PR-2 TaxID=3120356 RepID=UPI002FCE060D